MSEDIKEKYRILAECDIRTGKLDNLVKLLKQYEKEERYEACAGILKSLTNFYEKKHLTFNKPKE